MNLPEMMELLSGTIPSSRVNQCAARQQRERKQMSNPSAETLCALVYNSAAKYGWLITCLLLGNCLHLCLTNPNPQ